MKTKLLMLVLMSSACADQGEDPVYVPPCALDQAYEFGYVGGDVEFPTKYVIDEKGVITRTQHNDACTFSLEMCSPDGLGTDLRDLNYQVSPPNLANNAWGADLFGYGAAQVDGADFYIQRQDGKRIEVGDPCDTRKDCKQIPVDVQSLRDAFEDVIMRVNAACPAR